MLGAMGVPAQMTNEEKALLYALIYGLKPQTVLEIGVFEGGSSAIILAALDANGSGQLYSIDPDNEQHGLYVPVSGLAGSRWHLITDRSPGGILRAVEYDGGQPFDFVLVDGDHSREAVIADIMGVIPHLAQEAYLLFHDAYNPGVRAAIEYILGRDYLATYSTDDGDMLLYSVVDCGMLCKTPVYLEHMGEQYYGMRLLRFVRG